MNILKKFSLGFLILFLSATAEPFASGQIKVTILYDNYVFSEGTKGDWGFSCLIEGIEKTILFDTGTNPDIFWHNINKLGVDINKVEKIVISHLHHDHTGALSSLLEKRKNLPVYIPATSPDAFVQKVEGLGSSVVIASQPLEIAKNVFLNGTMGEAIKEQSLILKTGKGLVVVTGCAHPGIVEIVQKSADNFGQKVYCVFGGFHLVNTPETDVKEIISKLKAMGVEECGATHCTGDKAIQLFKEAFGENYIPMGVGKVIELSD